MVAFASAALGRAPLIGGVPDVVIGDNEDNLTFDNNWFRYPNAFNILDYATDTDSPIGDLFFTFLEETSANDINIIIDAVSPNQAKSQVAAADATNPSAWGTHEITNYGQTTRDYMVTFLDMVRSNPANRLGDGVTGPMFANPRRANGTEVLDGVTEDLPWHNNAGNLSELTGASRLVQLYVADDPTASDASRIGSDIITVISRNYANDALGPSLTVQTSFQFTSGPGADWVYETFAGIGACVATSGSGSPNGFIGMTAATASGAGGANFGRWKTGRTGLSNFQGLVPFVSGNVLYAARYLMSHNVDTSVNYGFFPRLRLGMNGVRFQVIVSTLIGTVSGAGASFNPHVPAQGALYTYRVPWSANEGSPNFSELLDPLGNVVDLRTFDAYFDVFDVSATQGGTWSMSNFDVVTTPRPPNQTPNIMFGAGGTTNFSTGWSSGGSVVSAGRAFTLTHNVNGSVQVNDPGAPFGTAGTAGNFLLWETILDRTAVKWEGGTLIRTSVPISVPAAADRSNFHWFRLRQTPTDAEWWATEYTLRGDNNDDNAFLPNDPMMPPVGTPFAYEAYASSQVPDDALMTALHTGLNDRIKVGLDFINNIVAGGDAGTVTYDDPVTYTIQSLSFEVLSENL
jgi:hypothetical protein